MIKITSVAKPLPRGVMWSGTAVDGTDRFEWFYVPRGRFAVRKEEAALPGSFMYVDAPQAARRAVQRAVLALRRSEPPAQAGTSKRTGSFSPSTTAVDQSLR